MTVKELKNLLNEFDDDLEVLLYNKETEDACFIMEHKIETEDDKVYCQECHPFDIGWKGEKKALMIIGY